MWDKIKELIGDSAPVVGGLLGGPAGATVGGLISKALGVENNASAIEAELVNNPDALVKLRELEMSKEIAVLKSQYDNKVEDNRHEEHYANVNVGDKQNARGNNHLYELQTDIGKRIFVQTSIIVPLLIMINILLISYANDLKLGEAMISMVSTLIGIALNNAYRERQSMIEFLFGSSIGSRMKDK